MHNLSTFHGLLLRITIPILVVAGMIWIALQIYRILYFDQL